ncbi:cyclase family protein [Patescibacteria group bacterium]|nr:cyclase family protein [Patescibacteria group bacterium]
MSKIYDISVAINQATAVYPGDPKVSFTEKKSSTSTLTEINLGAHTGTHYDAPRHVFENGKSIDQFSLDRFYGPCKVFDFSHTEDSVKVADLEGKNIKEGDIILLKTSNSNRGFHKFYNDYVYLDGDAADYLVERKISMVGIDAWSVKQKGGDDLRPHLSLLEKDILILETINLAEVTEGKYLFVGLPLKVDGIEGALARVVLMR